MPLDEERQRGRFGVREVSRELRPHVLWDGIKETVKWLLSGGTGLVIAGVLWLLETLRAQVDYIEIAVVFLVGSAMIYVALRISRRQEARVPPAPSIAESAANHDPASAEAQELRGNRHRPLAPSDLFELIDARPEPPPADPNIKWKRKLRVTLRSRAGKQIDARAPDWISSNGYIPFQAKPAFWSILQAEDMSAGGWMSDKWGQEQPALVVPPRAVFLASVGLDYGFSVDEINRRHATQRVGLLIIPVTIDGRDMEWRVRL